MVGSVGRLFGWIIVISYGLTILNYFVKLINRKFGKQLGEYPKLKKALSVVTPFIVKNHKIFGFITIGAILVHFYIQFTRWGFIISGAMAAALMITQASLGAYGAFVNKKRKGIWFILHRTIAVILFIAIVNHLIFVKSNFG
ncbi:MAG: hypothetical protein WBI17_14510 [Clostridiaceae bacterium]